MIANRRKISDARFTLHPHSRGSLLRPMVYAGESGRACGALVLLMTGCVLPPPVQTSRLRQGLARQLLQIVPRLRRELPAAQPALTAGPQLWLRPLHPARRRRAEAEGKKALGRHCGQLPDRSRSFPRQIWSIERPLRPAHLPVLEDG